VAYAVGAAGLAAAFLFLPILLLGFVASVVASVAAGEVVAWISSVDMTLTFVGIPALLSLLLLVIPLLLYQAAARRLGPSRATMWVGGLLAAALFGVALVWLLVAGPRLHQASPAPEIWYAAAFGAAALVTLVVSALIARRALPAAFAVLGIAAAGLVVLGAMLVADWGSPPRFPAGAQAVEVVSTMSRVELAPAAVHAGQVYFILQDGDVPSGHADFTFVAAGYEGDAPLPLTAQGLERLDRGDYQGTSMESGWGQYSKLTLSEGNYAFMAPSGQITVLEVAP
jgi:hypothetical protein